MDVVEVLVGLGGGATCGTLRRHCSGRQVRKALGAGRIRRVCRGFYALPPPLDDLGTARSHLGVLSHESAAVHWGFGVVNRPDLPHVTIPRHRHRRSSPQAAQLHYADAPAVDDVTTPVRTVVDCARTLPFGEALAIADSALRSGRVTRDGLVAAGLALRRAGRGRVLRIAELADGRSESVLESMLRAVLIEAGITGFVPQIVVADGSFSARLDLANESLRLGIEADGFEFHSNRKALVRDCRRHVSLVLCGWTVLRFSWEDVCYDAEWVVDSIRAYLAGHPCGQNSLGLVA